MRGIFFWSSG